jgi:hypothetical protein
MNGGTNMQEVYEITYCPICRKPWVPFPAPYGLTIYGPDCYHQIIATDHTEPTEKREP